MFQRNVDYREVSMWNKEVQQNISKQDTIRMNNLLEQTTNYLKILIFLSIIIIIILFDLINEFLSYKLNFAFFPLHILLISLYNIIYYLHLLPLSLCITFFLFPILLIFLQHNYVLLIQYYLSFSAMFFFNIIIFLLHILSLFCSQIYFILLSFFRLFSHTITYSLVYQFIPTLFYYVIFHFHILPFLFFSYNYFLLSVLLSSHYFTFLFLFYTIIYIFSYSTLLLLLLTQLFSSFLPTNKCF